MIISLLNNTLYDAQYVIKDGQQTIARLPPLQPNATLQVPVDNLYEVIASTLIDGNTYISAPLMVSGSMGFLAQVLQVSAQGTYEFDVQEFPNAVANQLRFQKTCINPVTFTINKNGKPLQSIVVTNSFQNQTLDICNTVSIYAVINGVTSNIVTTSNPMAIAVAVTDNTDLESGYFSLVIS